MSVYVTAWVYEHAPNDLEVSEMFVLVTLAWHADDRGCEARPSVACMRKETRLSERSIRLALGSLRQRGLIAEERAATNTRPTSYRFPLFRGAVVAPPSPSRGAVVAGVGCSGCTLTVIEPSVTTPPSSPPQKPERKKQRTQVDPAFYPDAALLAWTAEKGWDQRRVDAEVEQFREHHAARGNVMLRWDMAWRTWVRNGIKFDARRPSNARTTQADMNKGGTGKLVL